MMSDTPEIADLARKPVCSLCADRGYFSIAGADIGCECQYAPTPPKVAGDAEEIARKLLIDFYAGPFFDAKAARHADTVEAAILFTLRATASLAVEIKALRGNGVELRKIYDALPKGPRCRDCGDEDGRCPALKRPCDPTEYAVELIQRGLAAERKLEAAEKRLSGNGQIRSDLPAFLAAMNTGADDAS